MHDEKEDNISVVSSLSANSTSHQSVLHPLRAPVTLNTSSPQAPANTEGENQTINKAWFEAIANKASISAKINGRRYICIVKTNGSCELIASAYVPHEIPSGEVLLVLDGELVSITGQMPWEEGGFSDVNSDDKIPSHCGNIFVIFDVLTKSSSIASNFPVGERLKMVDMLLWNGLCKFCSQTSYARSKHQTSSCEQCCYGLRLKHPWFARTVVKRTYPLTHTIKAQFESCFDQNNENVSIDQRFVSADKKPVITSLYDGCILDAAKPIPCQDFCYKFKGNMFLTADLKLSKLLIKEASRKDIRACIVAEGLVRNFNEGEHSSAYVASPYPIQIDFTHYQFATLISKHRHVQLDEKSLVLDDLTAFNIIVECTFDVFTKTWQYFKLRPDKTLCNTSQQVEQIIQLSQDNAPWFALRQYLEDKQVSMTSAYHKMGYRPSTAEIGQLAGEWARWCAALPALRLDDLFWDGINSFTHTELQRVLNHQDAIVTATRESHKRSVTKVFTALGMYQNTVFKFHDYVKFLLYSLFDQTVVIDIGCGKLKMERAWNDMFTKVLGIEREERHFESLDSEEKLNNPYPWLRLRDSMVIVKGDACDPHLGCVLSEELKKNAISSVAASATAEQTSSTRRADCCFCMFSFQGVISSRIALDNFLMNLSPNLKDDGLLVAMMVDGDEAVALAGDRTVTIRGPGVGLKIYPNRISWAGIHCSYKNESYHERAAEEVAPVGLNDRQSNLNVAMATRGFELQSVLPLYSFSHLLPLSQSIFHDYANQNTLKQFSKLYKCVVWKRIPQTVSNAQEELAESVAKSDSPSSSLIQLLGEPWTQMHLSEATVSILIVDYLDIRSHFQLAMINKSFLRHYLRGSSLPFYSLPSVLEGLHIRHGVVHRNKTLFNVGEISQMGGVFRVIDPSTYFWLQRIPCVDGCAGCLCTLRDFKHIAKHDMNINFDMKRLYPHFNERQRPQTPLLGEDNEDPFDHNDYEAYHRAPPRSENTPYYPYPVDDSAMFCMCSSCFFTSFESESRTGVGKSRHLKFLHTRPKVIGMTGNVIANLHHTSHKASLMVLLILKSLFTHQSNVDYHFPNFVAPLHNHLHDKGEPSDPLEKLLMELVPELFLDKQWRSHPIIAYCDFVRRLLDNNFFQVWQMFEYGLAVELLQRGPPYPSCVLHTVLNDGNVIFSDQERTEKVKVEQPDVSIPKDLMRQVMVDIQQLIHSHATWTERWAALRFRSSKRQHGDYTLLDDDRSDGEEFTDVTPFHTTRW